MKERDEEFERIFKSQKLRLHMYFHRCLKNEHFPLPYENTKRTLTTCTHDEALLNSRKESLVNYTIEKLIWLKAANVWSKFRKQRNPNMRSLDELNDAADEEPDALYHILAKEEIEKIKASTDALTWRIVLMRNEGYTFGEIAKALGETEGKVKMTMHRFQLRLRKKRSKM